VPTISFALQAGLSEAVEWSTLARNAEKAGFEAFLVADHPGVTASPFVALATAAAATSRIALGTYVANLGVRDPLQLASDVATLDVVSRGRARLGVGAGHTPAEWTTTGRPYPTPEQRITRLIEATEVVQRVLAGETVTFRGVEIETNEAALHAPRPLQAHVPLLVGGNHRRLLEFAGAHADMVGIAGLGRTLEDGHQHTVRWSEADVDRTIATIREGARARPSPPSIDALVQHVEVTHDRQGAAQRLVQLVPNLSPADALACPYVLIGSEAELAAEVRSHRERWGIDRFTVRADAFDVAARLIKWLR